MSVVGVAPTEPASANCRPGTRTTVSSIYRDRTPPAYLSLDLVMGQDDVLDSRELLCLRRR